MVLKFFGYLLLVIFLILGYADDLRGAGLAGKAVFRPGAGGPRRAPFPVHHFLHGMDDPLPEFGICGNNLPALSGGYRDHRSPRGRIPYLREQVRAHLFAAVGNDCRGHGQLHGRNQGGALPYPYAQGFSGIPGLPQRLAFPLGRGDQPRCLAADVDARGLAETETRQHVVQGIYTHIPGQHVKIHVAGLENGIFHVHLAVAFLFPAAVAAGAAPQ